MTVTHCLVMTASGMEVKNFLAGAHAMVDASSVIT